MKTRVRRWSNSLALRIPKSFAAEAGLEENTAVDLSLHEGRLIVRSLAAESPTLEELVTEITDKNRHGEWDTGPAVGREAW